MKFDLTTKRFRLRRFNKNDLVNLRRLESDPDVVKHTRIRTPRSEEQSKERLEEQISRQEPAPLGIWAAEKIDTGQFVGWFMLIPKPHRSAELGYMIVKEFWGQGIATEVGRCLVEAGFFCVSLESIQAFTDDTNPASDRVLEKIGFQFKYHNEVDRSRGFEFRNHFWQPHLKGKLIETEPLREKHFEELYKAASDPLIWEVHPNPLRYQRDVFRKFFDSGLSQRGALLLKRTRDQKVVGSSSFYEFSLFKREVVIGYTFLTRECWGGEYNKDLKKIMLEYAFQFVDTVFFDVGSKNLRSQKALMKIGAAKVGEFNEMDSAGRPVVTIRYQITKSDFSANPYWR
jgi:N-acetyltransferase